MKKLVYRDAAGAVVNIGEWDYCFNERQEAPIIERDTRGPGRHTYGAPVVVERVATNPIPEGVTSAEEEVAILDDGGQHEDGAYHGLVVASDYVSLRRSAYPSIADQLDAFWKGGAQADEMRDRVLGVKARFPKAPK